MTTVLSKRFTSTSGTEVLADLTSRPLYDNGTRHIGTEDIVTPFAIAIKELKRRAADPKLRAKVEAYLDNDIPDYFRNEPVLYLCRHLASPNMQTLRFLHSMKAEGMKTVIGQDTKDLFVSHNQLKKALGKLPVCTGIFSASNGKRIEQFQKISIIDFNAWNGKPLDSIQTLWGESFVGFHNSLFRQLTDEKVHIENDSSWVDRYHRGDLLGEYKKFLALFIVHGIMFEDYPIEDSAIEASFVTDILRPAVEHIEREFGLRPLIAPLVPSGVESTELWEGYPPLVLDIVKCKLEPYV